MESIENSQATSLSFLLYALSLAVCLSLLNMGRMEISNAIQLSFTDVDSYVPTSGVTETERVIRRFGSVGFDSIGACLSPV